MASNPVRWFEIYVQDTARARRFYENVLQTTLTKLDSTAMDYWMFPSMAMDQAGTSGAISRVEGMPSGGNSTIVYFVTDDCAVEASRVEAAGGKIMKPKFAIGPYGFIALVFDTEGNLFGLHSMK